MKIYWTLNFLVAFHIIFALFDQVALVTENPFLYIFGELCTVPVVLY